MTIPGNSPLNYPPNSQSSVKRITQNRAPTTNDYRNFREGDEWLDKSSDDWYKLADITGTSATWVLIGGTAAAIETLTGNTGGAISSDSTNNVNIVGTDGITTSGSGNTVTITDGGLSSQSFVTDSGTAIPASGILNVLGGSGLTTSGSGNTITIDYSNLIEITSFTPTVAGESVSGTISYDVQTGKYCRLGPIAVIEFDLSWTTIGTASGNLLIQNFPLTWEGSLSRAPLSGCWVETLSWPSSRTQCLLTAINNSTNAYIYVSGTSVIPSLLQIGANGTIHGTIVQIVSL